MNPSLLLHVPLGFACNISTQPPFLWLFTMPLLQSSQHHRRSLPAQSGSPAAQALIYTKFSEWLMAEHVTWRGMWAAAFPLIWRRLQQGGQHGALHCSRWVLQANTVVCAPGTAVHLSVLGIDSSESRAYIRFRTVL